ncbi:MAG: T9SS type A sorting domain-containing protein [Bacteroidetes bacterium]|nr:T9SS type A sorting domain-containing protein [Bacteroidota bacterium]
MLQDSVERWGDYTGIQRKFNEPNTAWVSGSFVYQTQVWRTWVAKIVNSDSSVVSSFGKPVQEPMSAEIFPNPAPESFSVKFESNPGNFVFVNLMNASGQLVKELFADRVKAGTNVFSFKTAYLPTGIYYLHIMDKESLIAQEKIMIQR